MWLGKNWDPLPYRMRGIDRFKAPPIPDELKHMVKYVVQASGPLLRERELEKFPLMSPDICLVNFYTPACRVALRQVSFYVQLYISLYIDR